MPTTTAFQSDGHARRYWPVLVAGVLTLAACNLFFRLDAESLTEWDESLYAENAVGILERNDWVDIRFWGARDYYNSKPPLNAWLIAGSFRVFGLGLGPLRLPSACAAWLTIAILVLWGSRQLGRGVGLYSGVVLSTTYGFLYVHSGRTANTDAVYTLLITLVVVLLIESATRLTPIVWLGLAMAAVTLLRGPAVLLPLAIILIVEASRATVPSRLRYYAVAVVVYLLPVSVWAALRARVDGTAVFSALMTNDFLNVITLPLEGHEGRWWFYFDVLQGYQYDWLIAAVALLVLCRRAIAGSIARARRAAGVREILTWGVVAVAVPTAMSTKITWYLTPFYPVFAIGVGWIIDSAVTATVNHRARRLAVVAIVGVALLVAEGRLLWRTFNQRDLGRSAQGLLVAEQSQLAGKRVFRDAWNLADKFVAQRLVGAQPVMAATVEKFLQDCADGDFYLAPQTLPHAQLTIAAAAGRFNLYRALDGACRSTSP